MVSRIGWPEYDGAWRRECESMCCHGNRDVCRGDCALLSLSVSPWYHITCLLPSKGSTNLLSKTTNQLSSVRFMNEIWVTGRSTADFSEEKEHLRAIYTKRQKLSGPGKSKQRFQDLENRFSDHVLRFILAWRWDVSVWVSCLCGLRVAEQDIMGL